MVKSGALKVAGCLTNAGNGRVVRRPPAIFTDFSEAVSSMVSKSVQFVQEHKVPVIVAASVTVAGGVGGGVLYAVNRKKKRQSMDESGRQFNDLLLAYLTSARSGSLDTDIIDDLINTIEEVKITHEKRTTIIASSKKQFNALVHRIFDYTNRLSVTNGIALDSLKTPSKNLNDNIIDLQSYLQAQKRIIESVA